LELVDTASTPAEQFSKYYRWRGSPAFGGSPGSDGQPSLGIVINEILANTDLPTGPPDSIELYNPTTQPIDIGGWYLSDSSDSFSKYRIPAQTIIGPGEYLVIDESDFNPNPSTPGPSDFALSGTRGDDVWLVIADGQGTVRWFVDDVHFPPSLAGKSFGRTPNGVGPLAPLMSVTLGRQNSPPRMGPVLISEINYNPGSPSEVAVAIDGTITADDLEFVELYNATKNVIELAGWRLRGGIEMDFAEGTPIAPGGTLLVLSFNPRSAANETRLAAFRAHYAIDEQVTLVGGYQRQLSDDGQIVRLERHDARSAEQSGAAARVISDEVVYDDLEPWPRAADGLGASLVRANIFAWGNNASSWTAQPPSLGATNLFLAQAGDANLDRRVDQQDLVFALQGAKYLSAKPADWSQGDWTGDGRFNQLDLVAALQTGNYLQGPYAARPTDDAFSQLASR
jgi:hypothetical protein